jgi:hypothetical protein
MLGPLAAPCCSAAREEGGRFFFAAAARAAAPAGAAPQQPGPSAAVRCHSLLGVATVLKMKVFLLAQEI